mgnify:CR=1 FL=1
MDNIMAVFKKKRILVAQILLIIGMVISLVLLYEHFSPSEASFCTFGSQFDCNIVNKSPYANLDGISYFLTMDKGLSLPLIDLASQGWFLDLITANAFLGFLTLFFVFGLTRSYQRKKDFLFVKNIHLLSWMKWILLFGVLYGLYLIYIQHYIIKSYCILCLSLDVVLIISLLLVWRMKP